MGYPMTYRRVVNRNRLQGDYDGTPDVRSIIAGDLRRLETDARDILHLTIAARVAGITIEQAKAVLDVFFEEGHWDAVSWDEYTELYNQVMAERGQGPLEMTE